MTATIPGTGLLLRETAGLFVTGVTVVTARDPDGGETRGMTANGFMSVSLEPPLVVVSVARAARLHDVVARAGGYGVALLSADLEGEARRFAGMRVDEGESPCDIEDRHGVPVLCGGLAWMACALTAAHAEGDHTLFVGRVLDMGVERPDDAPLAFHRSAFARVEPLRGAPPVPLDAWSASSDWWG